MKNVEHKGRLKVFAIFRRVEAKISPSIPGQPEYPFLYSADDNVNTFIMGCISAASCDLQIQFYPFFAEWIAKCRPRDQIKKAAIII